MTVPEILELWQSLDQLIAELYSLHMAGTFAFIVAMFIAGSRLPAFIYYLAGMTYLGFSIFAFGFLGSQFARIRTLDTLMNQSGVDPDTSAVLTDAYFFNAFGMFASLGWLAVLTVCALITTTILRRSADI